jgi:hypothetical protein
MEEGRLPGFNAEAALYTKRECYRMASHSVVMQVATQESEV